jgi:two-component system sensor kinase FixL
MAAAVAAEGQCTVMISAEFQALSNAAVDAIIVIDERGGVMTFNAAAEKMFGHRAADVVGCNVSMLMPEPDRSRHGGYLQRYLDTGVARIIGIGRETQAQRADGEVFPVLLSVGEAHSERGRRFVGIIRDLSSQRGTEQRARSLEMRLAQVDRFNLMGEMAAGIAHEINQPLSAIATYAQAAKRIMQREPADMTLLDEICGKIDEQARRAGQVIANLRKFIRKQEIRSQPLALNKIIADVLNLIEADAHAEGIPVRLDYGRDLPQVRGDAVQLQQVLLNLTRNAVDAMRQGPQKERGISIVTELGADGTVRMGVGDHGHGVSRQLGDSIFHPFVSTKREGLGVGLAISRTIVQAYGGTLSYADNPEGGTVFTVALPQAGYDDDEKPSEPS